jgi:hypothetical protein
MTGTASLAIDRERGCFSSNNIDFKRADEIQYCLGYTHLLHVVDDFDTYEQYEQTTRICKAGDRKKVLLLSIASNSKE